MKNIFKKMAFLGVAIIVLGCTNDSNSDGESTPCIPTTCVNGGISTPDCGCNCPERYFGSDCSYEKMPSKILISKIRINQFPNNGGGLDDLGTNPDLFINLIKDNIYIYKQTTYWTDANGDGTRNYDYSFPTPIECTSDSAIFSLELWDYDSNTNNELMGTIVFSPYLNYEGFPTSFIIQDDSKKLKAEIFVTYEW